MSAANRPSVLESCRERFHDALATEPRIVCVMTEKWADDSSEPRLPGWMCGMTLASVKAYSSDKSAFIFTTKFEMYFRPKKDDPPEYLPDQSFNMIAEDAGVGLLSLPRELHDLIWRVGVPTTADACSLWLSAVSDMATAGRYPTLGVSRWTWAGQKLIAESLVQYHPELSECVGTGRDAVVLARPYRYGAFLDDICWMSAEACRIIQTFLRSSLTIGEILLLQGLVSTDWDTSSPGYLGERRLGSNKRMTFGTSFARLRHLGLVDSREGRRSLVWATPKGWRLALGLDD